VLHTPAIEDVDPVLEHPTPPLSVKLAVHVLLAFMFMVHVVLVPQLEQSPPHPVKVYLEVCPLKVNLVLGIAVSVTVPEKFAEHAEPPEPQFIPAGFDITFPFVGIGLMVRVGAFKSADSLVTKPSSPLLFACAPPEVLGKSLD
jgi:hypothetical protein